MLGQSHRAFNPSSTVKSNCTNTLTKFYDPLLETVQSLDLYCETEPIPSFKKKASKTYFSQTNTLGIAYGLDTLTSVEANYQKLNEALPQLILSQQKEKKLSENPQYQKVENLAMETRMNHKKRYLEERLEKKKKEKEDVIHEIVNLTKEVENLEADIQYLVNYVKYADQDERNRINRTNLHRRGTRSHDEDLFAVMSQLQKEARKREEDAKMKEGEIEMKKRIREKKKEKIKKLDVEIERLRSEYKSVRGNLINHYHNLLQHGRDTRSEGLVWIIKEILLLGINVKLSHLPTFLDERCISYLFNYAHIDIELHKISEEKTKLKQSVKNKKIDLNNKKQGRTFKTSLKEDRQISDMHLNLYPLNTEDSSHVNVNQPFIPILDKIERKSRNDLQLLKDPTRSPKHDGGSPKNREFSLKKLDSTLTHYKDKEDVLQKYKEENIIDGDLMQINMKTIGEFLNKKILLDKETVELIDKINLLEKKENDLKELLNKLKKREMNRLFKEFIRNDYERRFNIDKSVVISAMIGEDNTTHELSRQMREQKNYYDKLKTCRMFNPSELSALKSSNTDRVGKKSIFKSLLI